MGETLRVASAERLTVNESQFQWKSRADAVQERRLSAVARRRAA